MICTRACGPPLARMMSWGGQKGKPENEYETDRHYDKNKGRRGGDRAVITELQLKLEELL